MPDDEYGAKAAPVKFKTGDGMPEGSFLAYASVFGNKDLVGDIVKPGAFDKTLADWAEKGGQIPLLWGHNTSDPDYNLGYVTAEVDHHGLKVAGHLDMESPKAAQTYRLLKGGRVDKLSFSYKINDAQMTSAGHELKALDLFEVSLVPIGANPQTEVLAVKAAAGALMAKAGRQFSAKNEKAIRDATASLREAMSALESVLPAEAADSAKMADVEDQDTTSDQQEPPADTKSGPATPAPSVALAMIELQAIELEGF